MRPLLVVELHKLAEHGPKMLRVDDDDMVEELSAQGPDHSLRDGVGLWRVDRPDDCVDTHALSAVPKIAAIHGVAIAEQMARFLAQGVASISCRHTQAAFGPAVTLTCTSS